MTLVYLEGFETIGNTSTTGANVEAALEKLCAVDNSAGSNLPELIDNDQADGTYALKLPTTSVGQQWDCTFSVPAAYRVSYNASHWEVGLGFRFKHSSDMGVSSGTYQNFFRWAYNTNAFGNPTLQSNDAGDLRYQDQTGNIVHSAELLVDDWNWIEMNFKPTSGANGGFIIVKVNGTEIINETSRNIIQTFFSTEGFSLFQQQSRDSGSGETAFDDIYVIDIDGVQHTGLLGDHRIIPIVPTSDAGPNDWTPSTGSNNYALIDEEEVSTTDYVEASTSGDDDHYGIDSTSTLTVEGVQIDVEYEMTDGTTGSLFVGTDNGTADEVEFTTTNGDGQVVARAQFPDDPSGNDWTPANLDAIEITQRFTE